MFEKIKTNDRIIVWSGSAIFPFKLCLKDLNDTEDSQF